MSTTNYLKTAVLLGALTGILVMMGQWAGGSVGMIFALGLAVVMNFSAYWFSDKIVLRMYKASPVTASEAPRLHAITRNLVARAGLPMPALYVLPQDAPNAFATGRNPAHSAVAVTRGLMQSMNDDELAGVVAHELAHIKNRDILTASIAATIAGAVSMLASMFQWMAIFGGGGHRDGEGAHPLALLGMALIAPIAAGIVQMSVSRSREYAADATGAEIAGSPYGLASALEKLGRYSQRVPTRATAATSHMFIVMPLSLGQFRGLFATHPPIEERIRRLVGGSR
ncbi:protease HtpX [Acidobacteria bacterium Mor1]|nr:protease HtpX [Acidobacteria bacterium Mor1]